MDSRQAIKTNLQMSDMIVQAYLGDLSDADLLVRPIPGTNHIAWQLGHLINSEHNMIGAIKQGAMPPLPAGFEAKFKKETASSDDPSHFPRKQEFLEIYSQQRQATLKALEACSDADLDAASPEQFRNFWPNVGSLFSMQGSHWLMHAGQWAVLRRKLGRPPLF